LCAWWLTRGILDGGLLETSNDYCHPGIAGGTPLRFSKSQHKSLLRRLIFYVFCEYRLLFRASLTFSQISDEEPPKRTANFMLQRPLLSKKEKLNA
jgi:hypothetical protein